MLKKPWQKKAKTKYHAVLVEKGGHFFDSRMESELFTWLQVKNIVVLPHPPKIALLPGITWKVDFLIENSQQGKFYIEAKGHEGRDYLLKKKLWAIFGPCPLVVARKLPGLAEPWVFEVIRPTSSIRLRKEEEWEAWEPPEEILAKVAGWKAGKGRKDV